MKMRLAVTTAVAVKVTITAAVTATAKVVTANVKNVVGGDDSVGS